MALDCKTCQKHIEFSGERPSFCPYCGVSLSITPVQSPRSTEATTPYVPNATEATIDHPSVQAEPSAPERIGGYRLARLLGAGGMGAVYEGISEDADQHVAVKLLLTKGRADEAMLDRFRQEGRLASQIAHPNCVFVLRADEEAGRPYIVMELMSGETLRDEVKRRGPLPCEEAIQKTLDILDGLIEAHRLNILHRDVKPSNCFLMPGGRVKVGDFGLSKSLATDNNLTQTGAFLGTVLYAPPEQIRGDALDFTADVYSVCATLYFMLTGQAPFQHENPAIVIAKVLSEPPPDVKSLRPDVPWHLQKVVMKGLERSREKRWQTLEELRSALSDLVGRRMNRGSLGPRFIAHIIDSILLMPLWALGAYVESHSRLPDWPFWLLPTAFYYAVSESVWGGSIGKLIVRQRVCDAQTGGRASPPKIAGRTAAYIFLAYLFHVMVSSLLQRTTLADNGWIETLLEFVGTIAPIITMRRGNGYRGPHELISGTRVIQLPWPRPVRQIEPLSERSVTLLPMAQFPALPTEIGGYQPRGVLSHTDDGFVLLVSDPGLGRDIHLLVRRPGTPGLTDSRRMLARPARMRWLSSGTEANWVWDAFLAPSGYPLPTLIAPERPLDWPQAQSILEQVTDELCAGNEDSSLLEPISLDQIWIRADGRVQIEDIVARANPIKRVTPGHEMNLLREVARATLEGHATSNHADGSIHAPLPAYASQLLDRIIGVREPFDSVQDVRAGLADIHGRPSETTSQLRLAHVSLQGLFLAPGLAIMLATVGLFNGIVISGMVHGYAARQAMRDKLANNPELFKQHKQLAANPSKHQLILEQMTRHLDRMQRYMRHVRPGLNAAERALVRLNESIADGEGSKNIKIVADDFNELLKSDANDVLGDAGEPYYYHDQSLSFAMFAALGFLLIAVGWVIWAFIMRGGWTLPVVGLALVQHNGRPASRTKASVRAQLVWAPFVTLICICLALKIWLPQWLLLHNAVWWSSVAYLIACVIIAYRQPTQGPHEKMAGIIVVPR